MGTAEIRADAILLLGVSGAVAWQLYDESGNPTSEKGRADGVPTWGLVAAVTKPDGNFVIIY